MPEEISLYEAAKYPWSIDAQHFLKALDISLDDIAGNVRALQRVRQRLLIALDTRAPRKEPDQHFDAFAEFTSFFVAKAIVDAIGSMLLRRRWATVEAKRAGELLLTESDSRLTHLATQEFRWQITNEEKRIRGRYFSHRLHFTNYLAATAGFHEREWKLVNKHLDTGFVLLRKSDTARVLQAAMEKLLVRDIKKVSPSFPPKIQEVFEEIELLVRRRTDRMKQEMEGEIVPAAFPPCMQALLSDMTEGRPMSHIARFAITAFLLNVGMDIDSIIELFMKTPDFREDIARYQIEHIAGKRGSTAYTSPSCAYMVSVRLCLDPDKVETRRHPLAYYRRRRRTLSKQKST